MKNSTLRGLTIVIAYIFSNIVSYKTGFSYNILNDKFNLTKLIIDMGIFGFGYIMAYFSLRHFFKIKEIN
jgi:hypothetical protein